VCEFAAERETDKCAGRDITNYLGCLDEGGADVQPVWDEGLIDILGGAKLDEKSVVRGC